MRGKRKLVENCGGKEGNEGKEEERRGELRGKGVK